MQTLGSILQVFPPDLWKGNSNYIINYAYAADRDAVMVLIYDKRSNQKVKEFLFDRLDFNQKLDTIQNVLSDYIFDDNFRPQNEFPELDLD
jgi:hypothetical protein